MIKINKKAILVTNLLIFAMLFLLNGRVNATVVPIENEMDFEAALQSPTLNTEVRLDNDIVLSSNKDYSYNINSNAIFDLNGHTITMGSREIKISFRADNCKLTIVDNAEGGKITSAGNNNSIFLVSNLVGNTSYSNCSVEINGGIFEGPSSRKPIVSAQVEGTIGFTIDGGIFIVNYDSGSVFAQGAFDLTFITMTVKGGVSSGEFYISPDGTEISDIVDADSEIWVDGIRKYTSANSLRTHIGAIYCNCSSENGIEIKPKVVYGEQIVKTAEQLMQAISKPEVETIVLDGNDGYIETSEDLNILINGNKKVIDLNGCDLVLLGENRIIINYYTSHDVEFKDDRVRGTIDATYSDVSSRTIFEPINHNINEQLNLIINGASVDSTSDWIFQDTNHFNLTINNGFFSSLNSLFRFYYNNESSITLNRLIMRNYGNQSTDTMKLAYNGKFFGDSLSTILGDESRLIYADGEEDFYEVPKTAECGAGYRGDGTLNIMPIKGLEIPKTTIEVEYGYAQPNPTKIILENTSEETITIEDKDYDIRLKDDHNYFNGNIVNIGISFPLEILPGKQMDNVLSIKPIQGLTPGTYKATVLVCTTDNDEYRGKIEFVVNKAQPKLTLDISGWEYGESPVEPTYSNNVEFSAEELASSKVLEEKVEYAKKIEGKNINELDFSKNVPTHSGKYIVRYTTEETDYYQSGTKTKEFEITRKEMVPQVSGYEENYTYTGSQIKPDVIVKVTDGQEITLVKDEDYTLEYGENKNKGEGTIVVKSATTSNYSFEDVTCNFNILAKGLQEADVEVTDRMGYTGQALMPEVKVCVNGQALVIDADYTVTFEGQEREPEHQIDITVEGKGNYTGTRIKHTNIIEKMDQGLSFAEPVITKKYTDPKFTIVVTHNEGDGTISYKSSNTNVAKVNSSTGEVTIAGVGNAEIIATASETNLYKKIEICYKLNVDKADYETSTIKFENMAFPFDGKPHSIAVSGVPAGVKVTYTNNGKTDVGTYQVIASFTGDDKHYNAIPNRTATLTITNKSIANAVVSGIKDKTYTGKKIKQLLTLKDVNVELRNGIDYEVIYSANKNVGVATITITGKGNYAGKITKTFKINPKGTSLKKLTAESKQFTATWKAQKTKTTGYEVQYSLDKNFKSGNKKLNIKKNKTTSSTVKKLKAKKKYYVRIRTYKTVNGKKYYSGWSKVLNVKTKK